MVLKIEVRYVNMRSKLNQFTLGVIKVPNLLIWEQYGFIKLFRNNG